MSRAHKKRTAAATAGGPSATPSEQGRPVRQSDRWLTPAVVCWLLALGAVVILAAMGSVTYLAAIGVDPSPMVDVVSQVGTAVAAIGALVVQLANRSAVTRVERATRAELPERMDQLGAAVAAQAPPYPHTVPLARPGDSRTAPVPSGS